MQDLLNKQEKRDLKNYGYRGVILDTDPSGMMVNSLIIISNGIKRLHHSGFPFIKIFGDIGGGTLISLGWHDHWISHVPINIDSFGKNIFHVMPWWGKWKITHNFISISIFEIGSYSDFANNKKQKVITLQ